MCDSLVLLFFDRQREEGKRSKEWMELQATKVEGEMRVLSQWVGEKEFLVGGKFGLADVAGGKSSRLYESTLSRPAFLVVVRWC